MQTFRRITLSIALLTCGVFAVHPAFLWQLAGSVCLKGAYDFDGSNDFISAGDTSSLDITGDLTVSVWFRPDQDEDAGVVAKWYTTGSQRSYLIQTTSGGKLRFGVSDDGSTTGIIKTDSSQYSVGQWVHVVGVFDAGTSTKIYVDGSEVSSSFEFGTQRSSIYNSTANLIIGGQNNGIDTLFNGENIRN